MDQCLFCRIISGDIPSTRVYEDETVYEPAPADEFPCAEEPVFECFKYRSYWIEAHELMYRDAEVLHAFGLAQRINYRRGIHPE